MRKIKILLGALLLLCSMAVFGQGRTLNQLTVTGTLTGESSITLQTSDAEIVLTAAMCRNAIHINNDNDVIDFKLPDAEAGLVVMFYDHLVGVITVDPQDGDKIWLDGTDLTAGVSIDSPGALGDFIVLMAIDGVSWVTLGRSGTWINGGP